MEITLDDRQRSAVVAGLRLLQTTMDCVEDVYAALDLVDNYAIDEILSDDNTINPLSEEEIENLIYTIQYGPPPCDVAGCDQPAVYEGWNRALDPVLGTPTGLMRKVHVCEAHKTCLIGFQVQSTEGEEA